MNKKGFTLIELLVVITIIGILAVGGIQVYDSQIKKARDSTRVNDIQNINKGLQEYSFDNGKFLMVNGLERGNWLSEPSDLTQTSELEGFRDKLRIYIPNINNIYDPKNAEEICVRDATRFMACYYHYRVLINQNGYRISTSFESKSNTCASNEDCLSTRDGDGGYNPNNFDLGLNHNLIGPNPVTTAGILIRKIED